MSKWQKNDSEIVAGASLVLLGMPFIMWAAYLYFHHLDAAPVQAFIGVFCGGLGGWMIADGWRIVQQPKPNDDDGPREGDASPVVPPGAYAGWESSRPTRRSSPRQR